MAMRLSASEWQKRVVRRGRGQMCSMSVPTHASHSCWKYAVTGTSLFPILSVPGLAAWRSLKKTKHFSIQVHGPFPYLLLDLRVHSGCITTCMNSGCTRGCTTASSITQIFFHCRSDLLLVIHHVTRVTGLMIVFDLFFFRLHKAEAGGAGGAHAVV